MSVQNGIEAGSRVRNFESDKKGLVELLRYRISDFRFDRNISDQQMAQLRDALISEVIELCNSPRYFYARATEAPPINELKVATKSSSRQKETRKPSASNGLAIKGSSKTEGRKLRIVEIIGKNGGATTDEVMEGLVRSGLAAERDRSTIISMLRRMRVDAGIIDSHRDGFYELSQAGKDLFAQMTRVPARQAD